MISLLRGLCERDLAKRERPFAHMKAISKSNKRRDHTVGRRDVPVMAGLQEIFLETSHYWDLIEQAHGINTKFPREFSKTAKCIITPPKTFLLPAITSKDFSPVKRATIVRFP